MELQVRMLLRFLQGFVTLVFTKCENKIPANLRSPDGHGSGPNGADWRVLSVRDTRYRKRRLATMWERLRRLGLRRDRGRQGELKGCATGGVSVGPQAAAMRLNDRPTDGQPHTSPVILGRKECLEDLLRLLLRQSHAGIAHRNQQLTVAGFRLDGEFTSATRFLHGVDAVEHEIHEDLLQLDTIGHDLGKVLRELGANCD